MNFLANVQLINGGIGLVVIGVGLAVFYLTPLRRSRLWTVTVTPLASIIGSGFLVVAPLLYANFGLEAILAVIALSLVALAIGEAIRTNIRNFEPLLERPDQAPVVLLSIERLSNFTLSLCYLISVAFYIELLSAFALELLGWRTLWRVRLLSTAILVFIGSVGYLRGLHGLEALEKIAVNIKLAIIAALLVVLFTFDAALFYRGEVVLPPRMEGLSMYHLQLLGGMLLIVQGFETTRYLRGVYSEAERTKAMLLAQWIAAAVYILFVALTAPMMQRLTRLDETAVIDLVGQVALGFQVVLTLGALLSQFSAAVADTVGSGGILEEESRGLLRRRWGYVGICGLAILLIWMYDVFGVLSLASRAFAGYYGLQAVIAAWVVPQSNPKRGQEWFWRPFFAALAVLLFGVVLFATPAVH